MNEGARYAIAVLAADVQEKRERFRMLGMMNTPTEPEQKQRAAVEYELARTEVIEAEAALHRVQNAR